MAWGQCPGDSRGLGAKKLVGREQGCILSREEGTGEKMYLYWVVGGCIVKRGTVRKGWWIGRKVGG